MQCHGLWPDQSKGLAPVASSTDSACERVPKHAEQWLRLGFIVLAMLLTIGAIMLYLLGGSFTGLPRQLGLERKVKRGGDERDSRGLEMI
mmetsp:Transcript_59238/g.141453  ORF Transcript_59238/g.141453 Transcript_59238/m.141453 type:complete len:90 (+) Transcript_59238:448-717(+)